jgi:hypothetical protein
MNSDLRKFSNDATPRVPGQVLMLRLVIVGLLKLNCKEERQTGSVCEERAHITTHNTNTHKDVLASGGEPADDEVADGALQSKRRLSLEVDDRAVARRGKTRTSAQEARRRNKQRHTNLVAMSTVPREAELFSTLMTKFSVDRTTLRSRTWPTRPASE